MNASNYGLAAKPQLRRASPQIISRSSGWVLAQKLSAGILCQILLIDLVSGGFVALGRLQLAALCMWALLGIALLRLMVLNRPLEVACLLVGAAPIINLLRGVVLYSAVPLVYLMALGYVAWCQPARTRQLFGKPTLPAALLGLCVLYYILTLFTTFDLRENFRVLELSGSAVLICYLTSCKELLRSAIAGLLVSAWVVGVSAFPHLETESAGRLGIIAIEGLSIGNPFTLGTPLAFGLLALCLDRGQWLGLANRPNLRLLLLFPTVVLLALSTSRASWLIAVAGLVIGAMIGRKQRLPLVLGILTIALVGYVLTTTPLAETFMKGLNRTFTKDRDASSGRADQWKVFYYAFTDSPKAFLMGYGPGNGRTVFAEYSLLTPGIERGIGGQLPFHGLVMHIGAALGLLGLIPLGVWLILAAQKALSGFVRTGLVLPMVGFLGFVLASLTVTGFDTVSGTFLGFGLIAVRADWQNRRQLPSIAKSTISRTQRSAVIQRNRHQTADV